MSSDLCLAADPVSLLAAKPPVEQLRVYASWLQRDKIVVVEASEMAHK